MTSVISPSGNKTPRWAKAIFNFCWVFQRLKRIRRIEKKKKHSPTYQSINPKTFVLAQKCLNMIIPSFLFTYTKPDGKSRVQYWQTETPSILKRYWKTADSWEKKVRRIWTNLKTRAQSWKMKAMSEVKKQPDEQAEENDHTHKVLITFIL